MNEVIAFKDELLLLRWSDNSRDGMTVTFQIPGEYEMHPFKGEAFGKQSGKRYAAVLVEIGDDEKPVVQKGGPLSKEAAGLCKREDFHNYLRDRRSAAWLAQIRGSTPESVAAKLIRNTCGIESRAELDHNPKAADHFRQLKADFVAWGKE